MKNPNKNRYYQIEIITTLVLLITLTGVNITCAPAKGDFKKGDITTDGLTVQKSSTFTKCMTRDGVEWAKYSKYQIIPVEVSFRKNWKRDYNRRKSISMQATDQDMVRIKKSISKIAYDEFNKALQKKGGLTKIDQADSGAILIKARIIDLDIYAPEVRSSDVISKSYVKQALRAKLFLEIYDAESGTILTRWINTGIDPDKGYFEWANRITNMDRARGVVRTWADRLVEGMDELRDVKK